MNKVIIVVVAVIAIAAAIWFGQRFLSSAVSGHVDLEVARMVDEENAQLPRNVEEEIRLERIEHEVDEKKVTFRYTFLVPIPAEHFDTIRAEANSRTRNNRNLNRAMSRGVRVFHVFHDTRGETALEFETTD